MKSFSKMLVFVLALVTVTYWWNNSQKGAQSDGSRSATVVTSQSTSQNSGANVPAGGQILSHGGGQHNDSCFYCYGTGHCVGANCLSGRCLECWGDGMVDCGKCFSGRCSRCGGQGGGYEYVGLDVKWVKCSTCNATGRCTKCSGTGEVTCSVCYGSGQCRQCHGTDRCQYCDGKGSR